MRTLKGRVAVVTGAGSGIGRALCRALAREGCHIAAVELRAERLEELAEELADSGVTVSTHALDVSDRAAMATLPEAVLAAHGGRVHILVNNAGVTVACPFEDMKLEDWDWLLGVNLHGVLHGCHFFMPALMEAEEAHIVNVSSVFGIVGVLSQSAYCTSKFAVRGLTETLWEELRHTHIGVTSVHPGGVNTRIVADSRGEAAEGQKERTAKAFAQRAVSPELAAERIVRAIARGQRRLLITKEAYLMDWVRRLLPEWGNQVLNAVMMRVLGGREAYLERVADYRQRRLEVGTSARY